MMFGPPKPISEIMFNKFDTDKSGEIDAKEFKHLCFNLGYALTETELDLALKTLDDDASGKIELNEFKNWWKRDDRWSSLRLEGEELEKRKLAAETFNSFDPAKKGFIERENFNAFYKDLVANKLTRETEEYMRQSLDYNGDGKIGFSEYIEWLKNHGIIH